jgi:acetyl-CoA synthetase
VTTYDPIPKPRSSLRVPPNLVDYEDGARHFSWEAARRELDGLPGGGGLNIAHEAVDRHARGARAEHVALRCIAKDGAARAITYRALAEQTSRFANALRGLGVVKGDRVFVLSSRIPELYVACLGTLKALGVFAPLFSAFGPEPIAARIGLGDGRVLVTTEALYRKKIAPMREKLRSLRHVIVIGAGGGRTDIPGTLDFASLLEDASPRFEIPPTDPEDLAILHFTSGTTGKPKGAMHVHGAVVAHHATGKIALDLHPDDIFWCTADPGWVTGTSYGILSPLTHGLTSIVDEAEFDPERWYGILRDHGVTVWYTAPTAVRMMMRAGSEAARRYDLQKLRFVASVGEPLNPEAVLWGIEALGLPIHDNWWQSETGGIMIANYASMPIRPGSMGRPLPGIEAAIVRRSVGNGASIEVEDRPNVEGELALRPGWPSMFRGYLGDEKRYARCFEGGWYLTGDLARRDADGYYWFVGRADDVIKSAGHLIGPFEVESALLEHRAVAEAAAIGKPDPVAMEIVKAFVSLKPGFSPDDALARELLGFARARLGPAVAPKEIAFLPELPRTRSGKIMRRLLKARELGLPEGDTSTLEAGA